MKKFLFVCGVPRSGTTALSRLIGKHPQIVMGTERYKFLYSQPDAVNADLFTKDRFFSFSEQDTNLLPNTEGRKAYYDSLLKKFDKAIYVGDKTPGIFNRYQTIFERFDQAKVLFIVRDIHQVASSWNVRALNSDQSRWKRDMDYKQAVTTWNDSLKKTIDAIDQGKDILVVNYNKFFDSEQNDPLNNLQKLLDYLRIDNDTKFEKGYLEICTKFTELKDKELTIFEGQQNYINQEANFELYNQILELSI